MIGSQINNTLPIKQIDQESRGIIPRVIDHMFKKIWHDPNIAVTYDIRASYIEIYKEKIRDLLFP